MPQSKTSPGRLNIYVHDPAVRRQVKAAAAKRDLSVTEYCLRAIIRQLAEDGERLPQRKRTHLEAAVRQARQSLPILGKLADNGPRAVLGDREIPLGRCGLDLPAHGGIVDVNIQPTGRGL